MKAKRSGLTLVEMLVVVGIMALLVGLLLPAFSMVRTAAKNTKQRVQFTAIELGLAAFKNDYGDLPPSNWWAPGATDQFQDYCGVQKLAEALLGWDLLGFHPDTAWRSDGRDKDGGLTTYDPPAPGTTSLDRRRDRYVELTTANPFRLGGSARGSQDGLFPSTAGDWGGDALARGTYVLCDVFEVPERRIFLSNGTTATPGTPILYYRANTSKVKLDSSDPEGSIYCARDNYPLISLGRLADANKPLTARRRHPLEDFDIFYEFIKDPQVQARSWPYRPDSYILISAGADGLYGTSDDICNFR